MLYSGTIQVADVMVAINTTGRNSVNVTWTAAQVNDVTTRVSGTRLQYRIGTSGAFTDVASTEYLTTLNGTASAQTFSSIALPSGVNNQSAVQLRWVYYDSSGSGGRDRIRIDDITVASSPAVTTYTVTYNGNGSTSGTAPTDGSSPYNSGATVTVLGNTGSLTKTGYTFGGWNTAADGSGTDRAASSTFAIGANTTLYAKWTPVYTVTYNGNGNTGGSAPTDSGTYANGATVTVLANTGSLTKTGYTFAGWNTQADGLGTDRAATGSATFTMGSANVTLYAKWTINSYTLTYDGNSSTGGTAPVDGSSPL